MAARPATAADELVSGTPIRVLHTASVVACLVVVASFGVFVVDQTKGASSRQQEALATGSPGAAGPESAAPGAGGAGAARAAGTRAHSESGVHEALDEASNAITSPFAGLVSGDGEWASRSQRLGLALLLYGFGIGYLVRVLRVRV